MKNRTELARVQPESVGIRSKAIIDFIDSIQEKQIHLHSFAVLRYGKVAAEGYYKPYSARQLHQAFSVSKSVTSASIGIAIGEGLLTLEDAVADYFPEKLAGEVHPYIRMMRIKHLLAMQTAHAKSTNTQVQDWVESFLNTKPSHPPGTSFAYDTTGTHTLCAILQKVTGMTVHDYLRTRLFDPIGIGEIEWESCPLGINKGGSGIKCTTEDLARFGQLYLQQGIWEDKRILPEGWVELSTAKHADTNNAKMLLDGPLGYGYQFWRTRYNSYSAFGAGGQLVVVIPEKEAVFVSTANTMKYRDGQQQVLDSLWETLYPAIQDEALPENGSTYTSLITKLDKLTLTMPRGKISSPMMEALSGKQIELDSNAFDFEACEFHFAEESGCLSFYGKGQRLDLDFGLMDWRSGKDPFLGLEGFSAGAWTDEKTLVIQTTLFELTQEFTLTCGWEQGLLSIQVVPAGFYYKDQVEYLNERFSI
ncbi:serine hydrolase domain-containing protein [Paenibacillus sp. OAS669]|uniref:serine hydrolase domain-containing protein n=1 Tax=Paenibacillus sp. OAS669 TaxID=2663821 RepID=UPI0017891708|nr:serine hydrolase [Paenibacillus sp. OAS669]MBE1442075.1 CubicO group peptidase (beta-lactamase class C family) [Paenibacillus sp. OAS669]